MVVRVVRLVRVVRFRLREREKIKRLPRMRPSLKN